jgi:hypothetical protein
VTGAVAAPVIPAFDPVPLPAPPGLLHALLVATFFVHLVPMSVTLGGSFWALLAARRHRALALALARDLPTFTAFTVTTGVAALLFLQALYGPVFFAASVTMAWPWLAVPALALAGYALLYLRGARAESHPRAALALGGASAFLFLAVSLLQTTQMTFMLHPELHHGLHTADPRGLALPLGLRALLPRWLHLVVGATGTAALWPMILAARAVRRGEPGARDALAFAAKGFSAATGLAILAGLGWLAALPPAPLAAFRGGSAFASFALVASLALAVLALVLARRAREAADPLPAVVRCAGAVLALLGLMAGMRDVVRRATLAAAFEPAAAPASPQWGAIALFACLAIAGGAAVAWMVRAVRRGQTA